MAENAQFAQMVEEHGFAFIGPTPDHIRTMGDKVEAKRTVKALGIPCVPGSDGPVGSVDEAVSLAEKVGFPVLIKAAAGGGGKGMKEWRERLMSCARPINSPVPRRATLSAMMPFIWSAFWITRAILKFSCWAIRMAMPCIWANAIARCSGASKGDRGSPSSPALSPKERSFIGDLAADCVRKIGYRGVGTIEFLYEDGQFFFIEMNTRLQVEHTISEMITGIDLVREQIRVAAGEELGYAQSDIRFTGHAIECRINAENPVTFTPSPGRIEGYLAPGGLGVRIDSALYDGYRVPPYYDSLVAKLVTHGATRHDCIMRLRRALQEYVIGGIDTTIPLHQRLLTEPGFVSGEYNIHWLERIMDEDEH